MTPERINAVIAEWEGWKHHPVGWCVKHPDEDRCVLVQETARQCEDWKRGLPSSSEYKAWVVRQIMSHPTDFYHSLDATQESVGKVVTDEHFCWDYMNHLRTILKINEDEYLGSIQQSMILTATAAQRCEALLRTLGKWEGE